MRTQLATTRWVVTLVLSALAGVLLVNAWPASASASRVGTDVHLPPPMEALETVQQKFPYRVRKPGYLPNGMTLFHVIETAPSEPGESAYSVDIWYKSRNGDSLHIWQTNHTLLAATGKDPSAATEGESTWINGRTWQLKHLADFSEYQLSVRFQDGVTLSMDSTLSEETLRRIAASIE